MKRPQDRTSIIEDALGSFEWLSQIGVWTAFSLAGLSFLFWAGLEVNAYAVLSFLFLSLCTVPIRNLSPSLQSLRNFSVICAILVHALVLHDQYGRIQSVLLVVPAFLFVEIIAGWIWKSLFTAALWSIHVYWSFDFHTQAPSVEEAGSSILGALVTLFLVFVFNGMHSAGKRIASKKLNKLKGQNDFKDQRVHASRLQILGELSAALIHELSNPITNLQGFFSQVFDSEEVRLNVKNREIAGRIDANLTRARDLILGFRSFSRMQRTDNDTFKSSELFKDLELLSHHAFKSNKVELKVSPDPLDVELKGNRVEIGQIMMNFLLNALASTKEASVRSVLVGSEKSDSGFVFFVEDSGPGVPEELKEKIFRPFFSTKGDEGSGLGLYISKIIAEYHECKIEVSTARTVGRGARFELHFPQSRIIDAQDLDRVA